ncbi:MAG: alpha/beta fold hydrolase [Pseudomonadota bacterium]
MGVQMRGSMRDVEGMQVYFRAGGTGPPVLMLHAGLATGSLAWRHWTGPLAAHHRVIAPDIRGHGRTSNPAGQFIGFGPMAWDMLRFIETLDLDAPPHIVGHSCGAIIALHMAVYEPGHVGRLALLGAQPFIGRSERYAEALRQHFSAKTLDVAPSPLPFLRRNPLTGATMTLAHRQTSALKLFGQLWPMRVRPLTLSESDFAKIRKPMLLMIGEADPFVSVAETETLAALVQHVCVKRLAGHDHYSGLHDVMVAQDIVAPFLREPEDG